MHAGDSFHRMALWGDRPATVYKGMPSTSGGSCLAAATQSSSPTPEHEWAMSTLTDAPKPERISDAPPPIRDSASANGPPKAVSTVREAVDIRPCPSSQPQVTASLASEIHRTPGGLTLSEVEKVRRSFLRFAGPDHQVRVEELHGILEHIGYLQTTPEVAQKIAKEITPYSTVDAAEFMDFVERFDKHEIAQSKALFDEFDTDGSGEIGVQELRKVMVTMGLTPLSTSIAEVLDLVDENENGELGFNEFIHFMTLYRDTEGFTLSEVATLRRAFDVYAEPRADDSSPEPELKVEHMKCVLLTLFGPNCADLVRDLERQFNKRMAGAEPPHSLSFQELLTWARRVRTAELDVYKMQFKKFDLDGSGTISRDEVPRVAVS